jgi:hypothetical protein
VWFEMVIRPGYLTLGRWALGSLATGAILLVALVLVFVLNRQTAAASPLGTEWPSVGPLRPPTLGIRGGALKR